MPDQIHGWIVILIQIKALKLMQSGLEKFNIWVH